MFESLAINYFLAKEAGGPLAPQDVDVDTLYMLRINIKNVHDRAHRVKIVPPETSHFKLLYVLGEPLAPGLEVSAEVEFRAREAP